ncbi:Checkpoint protein hus1 [Microsporum ferrugineum]
MRFKSQLTNVATFSKFTASLSSLGKICWVRLEDEVVRFSIVPDQGTQVWAQLPIHTVFDSYSFSSVAKVINLEVPIGALHRALKSATGATSAQLRLTKKGNQPLLALTVVTSSWASGKGTSSADEVGRGSHTHSLENGASLTGIPAAELLQDGPRERETIVTQEIPIRVLHPSTVEGLHEPRCRDPDVHIILPSLIQLKSISERFTKLATDAASSKTRNVNAGGNSNGSALVGSHSSGPKLELSANMHGSLKLAIATDALRISSVWTGLVNPPLDQAHMSQREIAQLPSERMRARGADGEEGWAKVRIDGKDWGRVLSVGRLSPKVVACFIDETALILYVYLPGGIGGEDSCLTYYINSYAS